MNHIQKILSYSLSMSMIFSTVHATPPKKYLTDEKQNSKFSSSNVAKPFLYALSSIAVLGSGAYCWCNRSLNVVVLGGDEQKRNTLISHLHNNGGSLFNNDLSQQSQKATVSGLINSQVARGVNGFRGVGKLRAKFKNWNIHKCDMDSNEAPNLLRKADIVIPILDSHDNAARAEILIGENTRIENCMVASFIDVDDFPNLRLAGHNDYAWESDGYSPNLSDTYRQRVENVMSQQNLSSCARIQKDIAFHWIRSHGENGNCYCCCRRGT